MRYFFIILVSIIIFSGCAVKDVQTQKSKIVIDEKKVLKLYDEIVNLSDKINKDEALDVAKAAITHSKKLAIDYDVVRPALFHNTLINLNIRERGLCYHYANDLLRYLKIKRYKTFYFIKAVSSRGKYFEHTSLVLTAKNVNFKNSIVLDAWRDSGELYFSSVKDDTRYEWEIK